MAKAYGYVMLEICVHRNPATCTDVLSISSPLHIAERKIATLNISRSNLSLTESVGLRWLLIFEPLTIWLLCVFWPQAFPPPSPLGERACAPTRTHARALTRRGHVGEAGDLGTGPGLKFYVVGARPMASFRGLPGTLLLVL